MECFISVEQFSDFGFLLQQMLHIQEHSMERIFYDGVYFSKVTNLHCTDSNYNIYRLYHIYILEHVLKISYLKKSILREQTSDRLPTFK